MNVMTSLLKRTNRSEDSFKKPEMPKQLQQPSPSTNQHTHTEIHTAQLDTKWKHIVFEKQNRQELGIMENMMRACGAYTVR